MRWSVRRKERLYKQVHRTLLVGVRFEGGNCGLAYEKDMSCMNSECEVDRLYCLLKNQKLDFKIIRDFWRLFAACKSQYFIISHVPNPIVATESYYEYKFVVNLWTHLKQVALDSLSDYH